MSSTADDNDDDDAAAAAAGLRRRHRRSLSAVVRCALIASEAAAGVARRCRSNPRLLSMLVQEKCGAEANRNRFAHDFKTLADVLVQHVVAKRIGLQFPELDGSVYGEETDKIRNNDGRDVTIVVGETAEETLQCLSDALDDDPESARSLAEAAHDECALDDVNVDVRPADDDDAENIDLRDVGVWIDPIDSTNEYIHGNVNEPNAYGFHSSGLHCVTINVGLFDKRTGRPVAGVINQPFFERDALGTWRGKCYWAYCDGQNSKHSLPESISFNKGPSAAAAAAAAVVVTSSSETDAAVAALRRSGYAVVTASGAGYKMLCAALGVVQCYALTRGSTYAWDTCAAHAMLAAVGGTACHCRAAAVEPLVYRAKSGATPDDIRAHCNAAGVIASRDPDAVRRVHALLRTTDGRQ